VHGIGAAAPRHVQQLGDVEVGFAGAHALQRPGLVGRLHVQGIGIGVGVDGDRAHTVVTAGAGHADGDLAPVGDQNFGIMRTSPAVQRIGGRDRHLLRRHGDVEKRPRCGRFRPGWRSRLW